MADHRAGPERPIVVSLLVNAGLAGLKLAGGWAAHSAALVADGVNSVGDCLSGAAALFGLRVAQIPADPNHPYGHQRAETLATLVMAVLMAFAGLEVARDALGHLRTPGPVPLATAALIAVFTVVVKAGLYVRQLVLGRRLRSQAVVAMALDHGSDALASLAVLVGVVGARAGLPWLDPTAGLAVSVVIIRNAFRLGQQGVFALMDGFDEGELETIRRRVFGVNGVQSVINLRARQLGPTVAVDVTIGVAPRLSVDQAHGVAEAVERTLMGYRAINQVMVHVEPV